MASVVTFGQLPSEESHFLAYLQKSEEVWARAVMDDPIVPRHQPMPVGDFLRESAAEIRAYNSVAVYLGFRADVLNPVMGTYEVTEGGTRVPFVQFGEVVPGVHSIVGGTKVQRPCIDFMASPLVHYVRGELYDDDCLRQSNLCYYSSCFVGNASVAKPASFLVWAKKILQWVRRRTTESVPVFRCNYSSRATPGVAEAFQKGLKLTT